MAHRRVAASRQGGQRLTHLSPTIERATPSRVKRGSHKNAAGTADGNAVSTTPARSHTTIHGRPAAGVYVVGENSVAHRPAKGGGGTAEAGEGGAQGPRRLRAGGPAAARRVPRCTSSTSQHATCGAAPAANSPRHIVRRLPAPQRRHGPQPRRRSRRHSSLRAAPRSRRGPPPISSRVPPSTCLVARRRQVKGPSSGPQRGRQAWPQ